MIISTQQSKRTETAARLAVYLDEITLSNSANLIFPTSLIGKAMFRAYTSGVTMQDAHVVVRKHFRKHGVRHRVWWTEMKARDSWEFAVKQADGGASQ